MMMAWGKNNKLVKDEFEKAFEGFDYPKEFWQKEVDAAVINIATGFYNCHSIKEVLKRLKLVTPKTLKLNRKGKYYLWYKINNDNANLLRKQLTFLLIDPMYSCWKWAIVEGNSLVKNGEAETTAELVAIQQENNIADVFIDVGFSTIIENPRELANKNGWHCIKGKSGIKRDGIAEYIDKFCGVGEDTVEVGDFQI